MIILIGVLTAIALPRMVGPGSFAEAAARDQILSGLRFAQQQAMSRSQRVRFTFSGRIYTVEHDDPATGYNPVPGNSRWSLPKGVRFAGSGQVVFGGLGQVVAGRCGPGNEVALVSGRGVSVACRTGFARAP